jgi:hypothetical protein
LKPVPVSPRSHFPVAAEAAVAVGALNIVVAVAPVVPGIPDNVAVIGGYKVAQSLLRHALARTNVWESAVLVVEFLARSKV